MPCSALVLDEWLAQGTRIGAAPCLPRALLGKQALPEPASLLCARCLCSLARWRLCGATWLFDLRGAQRRLGHVASRTASAGGGGGGLEGGGGCRRWQRLPSAAKRVRLQGRPHSSPARAARAAPSAAWQRPPAVGSAATRAQRRLTLNRDHVLRTGQVLGLGWSERR